MERLERKELQKLCVDRRSTGSLPKSTKCNGSSEELVKILKGGLLKEDRGTPQLLDEESPYYSLLRYLAPYLTYDKLLLVVAYYPNHPLLKQLRDPNGKIWSDRVWVELGEPPLDIDGLGYRYYQLWATQSLKPFGELLISIKTNPLHPTGLWIQHAFFYFDFDKKWKKKGTTQQASIRIWAITLRGFEKCTANFQVTNVKRPEKEIAEVVRNQDNWEIVFPGRRFLRIYSRSRGQCEALDSTGNYYLFEDEKKPMVIKENLRYTRLSISVANTFNTYGVTYGGDHNLFTLSGDPILFTETQPVAISSAVYKFESLIIQTPSLKWYESPNMDYLVSSNSSKGAKGLIPEKFYWAPIPHLTKILVDEGKFLPRETAYFGAILGLDGYIYHDKTIYINHPLRKIDYEIIKEKSKYRLSFYTQRITQTLASITTAIAW